MYIEEATEEEEETTEKKLPKWLRNICLTKKYVFSDFENIAHCCYNGFEEDIYTYIYIYILHMCIYM